MIAIVKHIAEWIAANARFTAAVLHEARAMRREAEQKFGPFGF